ncbi:hypothetical protein SRHO_G00331960 [Serrasalmus rhombeus]
MQTPPGWRPLSSLSARLAPPAVRGTGRGRRCRSLLCFRLQVWRPTLRVRTEVINEESGQLLVRPQCCGPVTVPRRICVRRHYVLLMQRAVTCSWWILTNDFFMSSSQCPIWYASAARVILTECVEGLLARRASCAFTEHHVPKTSGGVQVTEVFYAHQSLVIGYDE